MRALADDFGCWSAGAGQVGIAPFDPQVVTFAAQDALVSRADPEHGEALHGRPIPGHRLVCRVDRQFAAQAKFDLHCVRLTVRRLDVPRDVGHRTSQHFQVRRQRRRQERQLSFTCSLANR